MIRQTISSTWRTFRVRFPIGFKVIKYAAWVGLLGLLFVIGLMTSVYFGAFGSLPSKADLSEINTYRASEVYSSDGAVIGKYYLENRITIPLDSISPHVIHALVSAEDERFFRHKGVDVRSLVRVLFKTIILRRDTGGGSTISQQLAKNLFQRKQYGILTIPVVKTREIFISRRLEKVYEKEALLELYLNTVPFGKRIFGIEVAANRYFGKPAARLAIEEAATLVGMLKATGSYNPVSNPNRSLERRNVVLSQMARNGYLSIDELEEAQNRPFSIHYSKEGNNEGIATHFREKLRQDLVAILKQFNKEDGTPYNLYTDGLKIYTTIDSRIQRYAEAAAEKHLAHLQSRFQKHWKKHNKPWAKASKLAPFIRQSERFKALATVGVHEDEIFVRFTDSVYMEVFTYGGLRDTLMSPKDSVIHYLSMLNTGVFAMDIPTGAVKAWVGGVDFRHIKYDHVMAKRQVGSTFKPIVYAAALEGGRSPCEYISNDSIYVSTEEGWSPANSEGHYGGNYSMAGAMTHSVNVASVRLLMEAGISPVISLAQKMGYKEPIPKVPSIALGSMDASVQDMVGLYAAFAHQGLVKEPFYLTRIETATGELLIEFPQKKSFRRGLDPDVADLVSNMLQMVVDSGTAKRLRYHYGLKGGIAGKTGTTQGQSDGWFVGYTRRLAMGVWVGGAIPDVRFRSLSLGQGANTALPIWGLTMQKITKDKHLKQYHPMLFPPLSDSLAQLMDCAPYIQQLIIEDNDPVAGHDQRQTTLEKLLEERRKQIEANRQKRHEQRETKKAKRKAKRKKNKDKGWWDRLFKKN